MCAPGRWLGSAELGLERAGHAAERRLAGVQAFGGQREGPAVEDFGQLDEMFGIDIHISMI